MVRGIPTADSGPPQADEIQAEEEHIYVWPDPEGQVRGQGIEPLYSSVPEAAKNDSILYEWLNLVEAIRVRRPREQTLAMNRCERRFGEPNQISS